MKLINRSALVVLPRQPYADWVNGLDIATSGLEAPLTLADHRREGRVYLVSEQETAAAVTLTLESLRERILDNELSAWDEFGDHWPPRSPDLFEAWFEVQPQLLCFDLSSEPLLVATL